MNCRIYSILNFKFIVEFIDIILIVATIKKQKTIANPADCRLTNLFAIFIVIIVVASPTNCEKNMEITFFSACIIEPKNICSESKMLPKYKIGTKYFASL